MRLRVLQLQLCVNMRCRIFKMAVLVIVIGCFTISACAQQPSSVIVQPSTCAPGSPSADMQFCDPTLSYARRAVLLASSMTQEEKLSVWQGHGLQPGVPRLNIKPYRRDTECFQGVGLNSGDAPWIPPAITAFPNAVNFGMSWDTDLASLVANATSSELRGVNEMVIASSNGTMLAGPVCDVGPMANTVHDPRWGRSAQVYGEDPFLCGKMAATMVTGLQQKLFNNTLDDTESPVKSSVTVGLFLGYHGAKPDMPRGSVVFNISAHDLYDQYLPAWEACLTGPQQALGVMCSHGLMNSTPSCANEFLLKDILRDQWQSSATVQADCCDEMGNEVESKFVDTIEEAVVASTKAGLSYCFGCGRTNDVNDVNASREAFASAISAGHLSKSSLDTAVSQIFLNRFRLGEFEKDPSATPYGKGFQSTVDSSDHRILARKLVAASVVLLENDGLLPLKESPESIAIIGPFGNCSQFPATAGWNTKNCYLHDYEGLPSKIHAVVDGFAQAYSGAKIMFEESDPVRASTLAQEASLVVLALGLGLEYEAEGKDRTTMMLDENQTKLIEAVEKHGKNSIVLLFAATPVYREGGWNSNAVLAVGYPGQEAGTGIVDVISGVTNPSGRLPTTWVTESYLQNIGSILDYSVTSGVGRTYRYMDTSFATYWFGYGLSYTKFTYSNAVARASSGKVIVDVDVKNSGTLDGTEIVQVYVAAPVSANLQAPRYSLCAFSKVSVAVGKSSHIQLLVSTSCMALVNAIGIRDPLKGTFIFFIGGNQPKDPRGQPVIELPVSI